MSPAYDNSPFDPGPALLIAGYPGYSFGSFDRHQPDIHALVTTVAITSNVATVGLKITEGAKPAVGSLISIQGTQTKTSGGAPNFNVLEATIASVAGFSTGNNDTGTVTFALTSTNIATTTDAGQAIIPTPEVPELLTGDDSQEGAAFSMQSMSGFPSNSRDIGWDIQTPSAPDTFTAELQVAMENTDADFTTVDTTTTIGQRSVTGIRANYVRIIFSAFSGGTNPSAIAKILT